MWHSFFSSVKVRKKRSEWECNATHSFIHELLDIFSVEWISVSTATHNSPFTQLNPSKWTKWNEHTKPSPYKLLLLFALLRKKSITNTTLLSRKRFFLEIYISLDFGLSYYYPILCVFYKLLVLKFFGFFFCSIYQVKVVK